MNTLLTFGETKTRAASEVLDGRCVTDPLVARYVNEAEELLMDAGDWYHTRAHIRFYSQGLCFALPYNVATVLKVAFGARAGNVWSMAYQYLSGGPGVSDLGYWYTGPDIEHEGDFPTFFPLPQEALDRRLVAFSDRFEDQDQLIRVDGLKANYERIWTQDVSGTDNTEPGEDVPINFWQSGVIVEGNIIETARKARSDTQFFDITSVRLPAGLKGHVTLGIYLEDTRNFLLLSKYYPGETMPIYRRYKIRSATNQDVRTVTALVKLRHVDLVHDNQVMQLQHYSALELEVKAISHRRRGNINQAKVFHQEAIDLLGAQSENIERASNEFDVPVEGVNFGTLPNLR